MIIHAPNTDGFADELFVPSNLEIAESVSEHDFTSQAVGDLFQDALLNSLSLSGRDDNTIKADINMLKKLYKSAPISVNRFFSASPAWRVFEKNGYRFATRRWKIGSMWRFNLHGYYSRNNTYNWLYNDVPNFQSRFTICLSGHPFAKISNLTTTINEGQKSSVTLLKRDQMYESHCIINADGFVLDIFEQSENKERKLTKAALSYLNYETSLLIRKTDWETIKDILPNGSIRIGKPSFDILASQAGIYNSEIWLNPGEPGMIYLKAFEITKGSPLSTGSLKEMSNEWIGWSVNSNELFYSNTRFKIYEGDWGKPYAARLEVWFTPDSGGNDRILMEKAFKIEGWQR